jgi:hypothetical protein
MVIGRLIDFCLYWLFATENQNNIFPLTIKKYETIHIHNSDWIVKFNYARLDSARILVLFQKHFVSVDTKIHRKLRVQYAAKIQTMRESMRIAK